MYHLVKMVNSVEICYNVSLGYLHWSVIVVLDGKV